MSSPGLQYYLNKLNPAQITAARELRGLTKKQLADKIQKSAAAITRIEKGDLHPELETFFLIIQKLEMAPSFFALSGQADNFLDVASCHFRSKRSTSLSMKRMAKRQGERAFDLLSYLEDFGITFLQEEISQFVTNVDSPLDIEALSFKVREEWGLGTAPISDLVSLLEGKGVRLFYLSGEKFSKVDAFSAWIQGVPCIFLIDGKPASRIIFDLAHELGHLIFHNDIETGDSKTERQANRFASAFLLPATQFNVECPRRWNFRAYGELKTRWKVSIAALLYRAKELQIISETSYQRACIQMRDYRKLEPLEFSISRPKLLSQAIDLVHEEICIGKVASDLGYRSRKELRNFLFEQGVSEEILQKIDDHLEFSPSNLVSLR